MSHRVITSIVLTLAAGAAMAPSRPSVLMAKAVPSVAPASGGRIAVDGRVRNVRKCHLVVLRGELAVPRSTRCASGRFASDLELPANTGPARTYKLDLVAVAGKRSARGTFYIVQMATTTTTTTTPAAPADATSTSSSSTTTTAPGSTTTSSTTPPITTIPPITGTTAASTTTTSPGPIATITTVTASVYGPQSEGGSNCYDGSEQWSITFSAHTTTADGAPVPGGTYSWTPAPEGWEQSITLANGPGDGTCQPSTGTVSATATWTGPAGYLSSSGSDSVSETDPL